MSESSRVQICAFRVGPLLCGIALEHVQEIAGYQPVTPVPLAPGAVVGLINLRGRVVTVIDLRCQLQLPALADPEHACNLVVRRGGGVVSLLVDEVEDVIVVDRAAFVAPPQTLGAHARRYVSAVLDAGEGGRVLALDVEAATALQG